MGVFGSYRWHAGRIVIDAGVFDAATWRLRATQQVEDRVADLPAAVPGLALALAMRLGAVTSGERARILAPETRTVEAWRLQAEVGSAMHASSTTLLGVALDRGAAPRSTASSLLAFGNPDGTLPAAEREVSGISRLFPERRIYAREEARKSVLTSSGTRYTNLHLATHGRLDADPTRSHLVLADGRLTIEDIWALPLDGVDLAVLSACNTARGELLGDDVISIEQAFVFAGAPHVVATLWSVPDEATSELMTEFYTALLSRDRVVSKSEALAQAQRIVKKHRPHPYDWAGFTLRGDWN